MPTIATPPNRQPSGGWKLTLKETGGTVHGATFDKFLAAANEMLRANGKPELTMTELLERVWSQNDDA